MKVKETLQGEIKTKTEASELACRALMLDLLEVHDPAKFRAKMAGYE